MDKLSSLDMGQPPPHDAAQVITSGALYIKVKREASESLALPPQR